MAGFLIPPGFSRSRKFQPMQYTISLVSLILILGCAQPDPLNRGSTVKGTVTLDGVPLAGGVVVFESIDGKFNPQSYIRLDGSYIIQEPPLGSCKIVVKTSFLKGSAPPIAMKGKVPRQQFPGYVEEEVGYYTAIPVKYEKAETSGFSMEIIKGNQTKDLDLTSK
jgi:hypothetical protein